MRAVLLSFFFFFNDTATTEIYTLSLHDALPILRPRRARDRGRVDQGVHEPDRRARAADAQDGAAARALDPPGAGRDRKSTRLNSSHLVISYAVFCLKKKKK